MVAGNVADLAYALQSAQGSPAGSPEIRSYLTAGQVMPQRTAIDVAETTGQRLRNRSVIQSVDVGGTPQIAARPNDLGLWLLGALGAESVTGSSDPWKHVITNAGTIPWMTFWRMLGNLIWEEFDDCKISQLVLTSASGQPLLAQATVMGLGPKSRTSETWSGVAITDENPLMHYDASPFLVFGTAAVTGVTAVATTDIITSTGHGLTAGTALKFTALTGGAGLVVGTIYYVRDVTTNTFKVSLTNGGTAVDITTDMSAGTYTAGQDAGCVNQVILTINNNAVIQRGDSISGCSVTEGLLDITLQLDTLVTNASLYNQFHYGAAAPSDGAGPSKNVLELTAGVDLIWLRSATRSLEIFCPRLQLQTLGGYEPNPQGNPLVDSQTYKVYQPASGAGITATVLNGHAAY